MASRPRSRSTTRRRSSTNCARRSRRWRRLPNPDQWQVTPVTATLLRHWRALRRRQPADPPVLLPGRGGRDGDLARRGRAEGGAAAGASSTGSTQANAGRQPRPLPHRAEARDRRRQDHRHGDADRLAGDQRRPQPRLEDLLARLPDRHPRHHHPRPAAGAPCRTTPTAITADRDLVPTDMMADIGRAKIVITNYHAFKLRETMQLANGHARGAQGPRRPSRDAGDRRPDAPARRWPS